LPITCLCARIPLAATLFLGGFLGTFVRLTTFEHGTAPVELLWLLVALKIGDLLVGLAITSWRAAGAKRRASTT
jgi:hypothetical protein